MKTAKQELQEVLERLPDDAPLANLIHELQFKASVLRGLEQAQRGEGTSHEELKSQLNEWRASSGRQKQSNT
jgi:predicted transcriptional regulator